MLRSLEELRDQVLVRFLDLHALFLGAQIESPSAILLSHLDHLLSFLFCLLFLGSLELSKLDLHLVSLVSFLLPLLLQSRFSRLILGDDLAVNIDTRAHILRALACATLLLDLVHALNPLNVVDKRFLRFDLLSALLFSFDLDLLFELFSHLELLLQKFLFLRSLVDSGLFSVFLDNFVPLGFGHTDSFVVCHGRDYLLELFGRARGHLLIFLLERLMSLFFGHRLSHISD